MKSTLDTTLAQTYTPVTKLVAAPSVIGAIDSAEKLQQLSETEIVQNAVFSVNDELQIVDADGLFLGEIGQILTEALRKRVIPVIRIGTSTQAQKLIAWLRQRDILDIAVISADAQILQSVRHTNANIRAIWDCSDRTEARLSDIVARANESGANTVVFADAMASTENVWYLQARLKSVWMKTSAATEVGIADLIGSGACGIWARDAALVYKTYQNYVDSHSMSRLPINIAHRGLCISNYENALESCLAAYESGATHMEIDMKLTKDGHIVIMHDDDISRTTNGSGKVEDMTLEQLRRYKITKNHNGAVLGEGVNIPTLEEIFAAFRDKDVVLVSELKSPDAALVTAFAKMLEKWPEMTEKIVVIAFSVEQLARMHEQLPHIPTGNLNSFTRESFVNDLIVSGNYYTVPDTGYGNVDDRFLANDMLTRGIMGYCWTYGSAEEVARGFPSGVLGMTNNVAETMADFVKAIDVAGKTPTVGANDTALDVVATTYGGEKRIVRAQIFLKEERADGTYAILKYRYTGNGGCEPLAYSVYSRAVKLTDRNADG